MIAITSFSPEGYELYGKKFLDSAADNWPTKIIAYVDNERVGTTQTSFIGLDKVNGYTAFQQYCDSNPVFSGRVGGGYSFNYDAKRFSHKVFAQFDALTNLRGKVFWLDADMVFKKKVPLELLHDVFDDKTICLLMREGLHAETGFVGFDTDRADFQQFLKSYIDVYRKGRLFNMKYWIDGHVIQEVAKQSGVSFNNLSSFFKIPEDRNMNLEDLDVMNRSILGEYIQHNKGRRKHAA